MFSALKSETTLSYLPIYFIFRNLFLEINNVIFTCTGLLFLHEIFALLLRESFVPV